MAIKAAPVPVVPSVEVNPDAEPGSVKATAQAVEFVLLMQGGGVISKAEGGNSLAAIRTAATAANQAADQKR